MSTLTPAFSNFPIMASGNMDYVDGNSYSVDLYSDPVTDTAVRRIQHKLSGRCWVRNLIDDGSAKFACIVAVPWCSYRSVFTASTTTTNGDREVVADQSIDCTTEEYASPLMLQPIIVVCRELKRVHLSEEDGINQLWIGSEVDVPKGAKIAYGPCFHGAAITQSILKVKEVDRLPKGCFEVYAVADEGFYFSVETSRDLFEKLKNPGNAIKHRDSIYCFALSQGLDILRKDYQEDEKWRNHVNLRHLHSFLKKKGWSTWDEDNFKPNSVVAQWVPHEIDPMDND